MGGVQKTRMGVGLFT